MWAYIRLREYVTHFMKGKLSQTLITRKEIIFITLNFIPGVSQKYWKRDSAESMYCRARAPKDPRFCLLASLWVWASIY